MILEFLMGLFLVKIRFLHNAREIWIDKIFLFRYNKATINFCEQSENLLLEYSGKEVRRYVQSNHSEALFA